MFWTPLLTTKTICNILLFILKITLKLYPLECGRCTYTLWSVAAVHIPSVVWQLYSNPLECGSYTYSLWRVWQLYIYPLECGSYTYSLWRVLQLYIHIPSKVWQLYKYPLECGSCTYSFVVWQLYIYLLEWGSCTCVHIPGLHNGEQELAWLTRI
jgi:hypothetical protein